MPSFLSSSAACNNPSEIMNTDYQHLLADMVRHTCQWRNLQDTFLKQTQALLTKGSLPTVTEKKKNVIMMNLQSLIQHNSDISL